MKIPEYICSDFCENIYCFCSVNKDGIVVLGEEYLYKFFGKQNGISLQDFIHPDFWEEYVHSYEETKVGEQNRLVVAVRDHAGKYHLFDLIITNEGKKIGTEFVNKIELYNIFSIEDRLMLYSNNIKKYRCYLTMKRDIYFDYDVVKDVFTIFHYEGVRAIIHVKCALDEFYEKVKNLLERGTDIHEVDELYHFIKSARGNFTCKVRGPFDLKTDRTGIYKVDGKTIYKHNAEPWVVGIFTRLDENATENIPYYELAEGRDSATGLYNKRACHEYAMDLLGSDSDKVHYMCIIDIDNFKGINDNYGHLFGDEVIMKLSEIMESSLNERGIVGRFGGDEFFILTDWIENDMEIRSLLTSIRQKCSYAFEDSMKDFRVTLSIGVSKFPDDGSDYDTLFKTADTCLYLAKNKGKNRFIIYDKEKHGDIKDDSNSIRYATSPLEKAEYLADVVADVSNKLYESGKDALDDVFAILRTNFEVDGIRVYSGTTGELLRVSGTYKQIPDIKDFIVEKRYVKACKLKRFFKVGNIDHFHSVDRDFAEKTLESNIVALICFYFDVENDPNSPYIFFYDVFNHVGRWADFDRNYLHVVSKIITRFLP